MKKTFLLLIVLLSFIPVCHAQLDTKVDERFELTSIIFGQAGVLEYCQSGVPSYKKDCIDAFMEQHAYTEPVNFIRELAFEHGIRYAAVSTTASMLEIKDGSIKLQDQYNISDIPEADSRWTEELFEKYLIALNTFYKESNFHQFFEDHRELYSIAEQRMNEYIADVSTDWIESFFGKPFDPNIKVYICMNNGPNNYAIPEGVLIGIFNDETGLPAPYNETLPVLIHEILHHYTNPLFELYWESLKPAGEIISPRVKEEMAKIAYSGAHSTLCEWLNNLFVLMYLRDTENPRFKTNIYFNMKRGFIWMERGVDFMENFYAHRDLYPTIEEFMPQLVAFLNFTAENFEFVEREAEYPRPYIVNIYPAPGSDITQVEEMIITFSEPMLGSYGFNGWPEGTEPLACIDGEWLDDYRFRFVLTPGVMTQGQTYGIKLVPAGFISAKYMPLNEKHTDLIFKID